MFSLITKYALLGLKGKFSCAYFSWCWQGSKSLTKGNIISLLYINVNGVKLAESFSLDVIATSVVKCMLQDRLLKEAALLKYGMYQLENDVYWINKLQNY